MASEGHTEMLTLRLLGPFAVSVAGKPLPRLRTRKGQWLLALLALRHDQEVERDWLAGTLWSESLEEQARTNLRLSLTDLRRALGDQSCRLQSPTPRTLRLDLSGADVDVIAFDRALARGDCASLQEAIALYRGPLLEGCSEEWCVWERQAREQAYLQARETLASAALANADTATAVGHLRRIIAIDPFRESAQRALMQAHAAAGDYGAAVLTYRDLRLRLHDELHTEPDPQTRTLFQQIRAQARNAGKLPIPNTDSPAASQEKASPPSRAASADVPNDALPTNLPALWTSFIGREKEIAAVHSLLAQTRLLTLTGSGGCGKTRLALQAAADRIEDYPDGVWLVELASLSDPALVVQAVAATMGVREEPGNTLLQTVTHALRSRRLLLMLDNCEHLLTACARLAETLLRNCPHLQLLATSRESLGLAGEQVYRVPSLPAPDPAQLPRNEKEIATIVSEYDAVRLFVERARLHMPEFLLTPQNAPVVASVCHRLDGIPLAIELAAGRTPVLSVEEINARLEDRFRLLTGGSRTALPRQQTLRAALDWGYDLLTPKEQQLLQRLSVFAGGWTLEAAEQVTGDREARKSGVGSRESEATGSFRIPTPDFRLPSHEVLDLLASLVGKSLVIAEEREGTSRYRLLETIRAYAWQRLQQTGAEKRWRERHLAYFLRLAEEAAPQLTGSEQAAWLDRLAREHDDLRAALEWCWQEPEHAEAGLRLTGALWRFWEMRGYFSEGREHLRATLSRDTAGSRTPARARALHGAGILASEQGDYAAAHALYEESLALSRELGDTYTIAHLLNNLGNVAAKQDDYATARALYEESLAIRREIGDRQGMVYSLINLGSAAKDHGDYAAAYDLCGEGLTISKELGDKQGIGFALMELADVAAGQGQTARAARLWAAAEALRAAIDSPLPSYMQAGYDRKTAAARVSLGEAAYERAWEVGRAMTVEEAIAYALNTKEQEAKGRRAG